MNAIRAVALDVDGVLTDGGFWLGPGGEEWKRFSFADVMGISLARRSGISVTLVSGEDSSLVDQFAERFGIADVEKHCKDKAIAVRDFSERAAIALCDMCFMGNDVNDIGAMKLVGLAAAPSDAQPAVLKCASFVTKSTGGNGAVRELIDALIAARLVVR